MNAFLFVTAILLALAPLAASAQIVGEMIADRPGRTTSAMVVPTGSAQIETGVLYVNDYYRWTFIYPSVLVRVGVMDDLELRVTGEYVHDRYQLGFTDYVDKGIAGVSIGGKVAISRESGFIPAAALVAHLSLPVGSPVFRPAYVAPDFRFAFSHSLGGGFEVGANVGGEWNGDDHGGSGAAVYSLSLGFDLSESWSGYLEAYGSMWGDGRPSHLLDGGLTVSPSPNFQLDASYALPFTERGPDYYANVGFSWRIPE